MGLVVRYAAVKGLASIPKAERDALVTKSRAIASNPYGYHPYAKRPQGTAGFSVRQGGYRALYSIAGNSDVIVIDASPRGSIYKP